MVVSVVLASTLLSLSSAQLFSSFAPAPARAASPRLGASARDEGAIVSGVISQLEPAIAQAVAAALAAQNRPTAAVGRPSGASAGSGFNSATDSDATPAKYNYVYKVIRMP